MTANPEQFQAILLRKDHTNLNREYLNIKGEPTKTEETLNLQGISLGYKLNFEKQISEICTKAVSQLNVLKRLTRFDAFDVKKILLQSLILWTTVKGPENKTLILISSFDYCPLVRFSLIG